MALHDISKNHHQRAIPKPNVSDTVGNRMAHGTVGFTLVKETSGDVPYISVKDGRLQVYRADGSLLFQAGFRDSDGDGAVDLAKPGSELT